MVIAVSANHDEVGQSGFVGKDEKLCYSNRLSKSMSELTSCIEQSISLERSESGEILAFNHLVNL